MLNGAAKTGTARVALGTQRFALDGSLDLARLAIDASVEMEDAADPRATAPPSVTVQWRGPIANPDRRLDAAALGAAINMRALERETKRLEAEYGRSPVMDAGHSTDAPDGSSAPPTAPRLRRPGGSGTDGTGRASCGRSACGSPSVASGGANADPARRRRASAGRRRRSGAGEAGCLTAPAATPPKPRRARVVAPPATREPVDQPDFGGPDFMLPPLPPPITIGPDRPLRPGRRRVPASRGRSQPADSADRRVAVHRDAGRCSAFPGHPRLFIRWPGCPGQARHDGHVPAGYAPASAHEFSRA